MTDDTEPPTKNTLFLAVTRPALWAGIPIEAAVLLLISSASVLIWTNSPVYAALVVAFGYRRHARSSSRACWRCRRAMSKPAGLLSTARTIPSRRNRPLPISIRCSSRSSPSPLFPRTGARHHAGTGVAARWAIPVGANAMTWHCSNADSEARCHESQRCVEQHRKRASNHKRGPESDPALEQHRNEQEHRQAW